MSYPVNRVLLLLGIIPFLFACHTSTQLQSGSTSGTLGDLRSGFVSPPDSIKPYVYWYWISDNISKEGITKDLEAMAKVGIGEAFIGNIGLETVPYGNVKVLSDEWWELTRFAIKEGQRLGVDIGIFNSPGWSQSGGPWVPASQAMRYLRSTDLTIEGGKLINLKLPPIPDEDQDAALIAFPASGQSEVNMSDVNPKISLSIDLPNAKNLLDRDVNSSMVFTKEVREKGLSVSFESGSNLTTRSIVIYPDTIPFSADVELQAYRDGGFKTIKKFLMDRSNNMISVGQTYTVPYRLLCPKQHQNNTGLYSLI
jgi:hypothetical protein